MGFKIDAVEARFTFPSKRAETKHLAEIKYPPHHQWLRVSVAVGGVDSQT